MRILLISDKPPWPPDSGGSIALVEMIRDLSASHDLTLLSLRTRKHPSAFENWDQPGECRLLLADSSAPMTIFSMLTNLLFSKVPYNISRYKMGDAESKLRLLLKNEKFDVIQFEGLTVTRLLPVAQELSQAVLVYRAHNVESALWRERSEIQYSPITGTYLRLMAERVAAYERDIFDRIDGLIAISREDENACRMMGNTKPSLVVCPLPGLRNILPGSKGGREIDGRSVRFLGSLDWEPNLHGLSWFIGKVWPEVVARNRHLVLTISGRGNPGRRFMRLVSGSIRLAGYNQHPDDFIRNAALIIVPLFAGSGVRIKILQALAAGTPVISTTKGAEGLPGQLRELITITDDPLIMAEEVIKITDNPGNQEQRERALAEAATRAWEAATDPEKLHDFYSSLRT